MFKFFVLVLVLLAGLGLYRYASHPLPLAAAPLEFSVLPGSGLTSVTQQLQTAQVLPRGRMAAMQFWLLARITGRGNRLQAGFYELAQAVTPLQLLDKLASGQVVARQIRFIEGWNINQVRDALNACPWIRHDTADLSNAQFAQMLGVPATQAEGWLFPATYDIEVGSDDMSILHRAYATMQQRLQQAWNARAAGLPYATPTQALIMASIIEKETAAPTERPLIAAVFINRLHQGMRLQTDPTVIYGIGAGFDGNLRKSDLQTDTPYNTYTRAGLPPTPIAMPGMASIEAALHPASSDALYFVSRGDGTHCFTNRLVDHNRAVARYQKRK